MSNIVQKCYNNFDRRIQLMIIMIMKRSSSRVTGIHDTSLGVNKDEVCSCHLTHTRTVARAAAGFSIANIMIREGKAVATGSRTTYCDPLDSRFFRIIYGI